MSRANVLLLTAFLLLLGAVLAVENPFGGDEFARSRRREHLLFPGFDGVRAAKVEIRAKDREVVLARAPEGTWTVPAAFGHGARTESVVDLFDRIRLMRVRQPVSDRPENREKYNVGEEGIDVRVSDEAGKPLAEFVQGKFAGMNPKDPDFERKFSFAAFVRRADSPEVYLIDHFLPLGTTSTEWLDTALVRFDPTSAVELSVEGSLVEGKVRLAKEGEVWRIVEPEPGPAKKEAAEAWLQAFAYSVFKDVAGKGGDLAKFGLAEPKLLARAKTLDGREYRVRYGTGAEEGTTYAAKGEDDPYVYVVQGWSVENLKKKLADFREPPASQPASAPAESRPAAPPEPPATQPR